MTASIFMNGYGAVMLFHIKITYVLITLGVTDSVLHFRSIKGHHEIIEPYGPFSPANMRPLLVAGHKGTVVTGINAILIKHFTRKLHGHLVRAVGARRPL